MTVHDHSPHFSRRRLRMEALEPRMLLSAQVQVVSPPLATLSSAEMRLTAAAPLVSDHTTQTANYGLIDIGSNNLAATLDVLCGDGTATYACDATGVVKNTSTSNDSSRGTNLPPSGPILTAASTQIVGTVVTVSTSSPAGHSSGTNPPPCGPAGPDDNPTQVDTAKHNDGNVSALPEPAPPRLQRIVANELVPSANASGLIDVTPRSGETVALALAPAAAPREMLTTQADTISEGHVVQSPSDVGGGSGATSPGDQEIHAQLDGPPPTVDRQLDGTQGRSQAFDLAATRRPAAAHPTNPASPLLAASLLPLADAGSTPANDSAAPLSVAALAPASRSTTAADSGVSPAAATPNPVRIDADHRSWRTAPLVVFAIAAGELVLRRGDSEKDGTSLYPPKPPSRNR